MFTSNTTTTYAVHITCAGGDECTSIVHAASHDAAKEKIETLLKTYPNWVSVTFYPATVGVRGVPPSANTVIWGN